MNGVDNVYTRHTPLINETIEDLIKGKLNTQTYPFLGNIVMSKR